MSKYTSEDLLKLITKEEFEAMDAYRRAYNDAECGTFVDSKDLLLPWAEAKAVSLIDLFGGKLILEKEVDINELTSNEKIREVSNNTKINNFLRLMHEKITKLKEEKYISYNIGSSLLRGAVDRLCEEIFDNKLNYNIYFNFVIYEDTSCSEQIMTCKKTFLKGTKTTKLYSFLAEILDMSAEYEEFRIAQSMLRNCKNKVTLCLSIHPLDYMTMSDNTYNWSSCMSWRDRGCYRAGTVEMMNSEVVVVAYIKGSELLTWRNDSTWNSKRWRELFIIDLNDNGVVAEIKPYPYVNAAYSKAILSWIEELALRNKNIEEKMYDAVFNENEPGDYSLSVVSGLMYNDIHYNKNFCGKIVLPQKYDYRIKNFSGVDQCMNCGCVKVLENANTLSCYDCGGYEKYCCERCGYTSDDEDDFDWIDDWCCCSLCRDRYYTYSDFEERYIENDFVRTLLLLKDGSRENKNFDNVLEEIDIDYDSMHLYIKDECHNDFYNRGYDGYGHPVYLDELTPYFIGRYVGHSTGLERVLRRTTNYEGTTYGISSRWGRWDPLQTKNYMWTGEELKEV